MQFACIGLYSNDSTLNFLLKKPLGNFILLRHVDYYHHTQRRKTSEFASLGLWRPTIKNHYKTLLSGNAQ